MAVLIVMLPVTLAEELNLVLDANGNLVTGDSFYREYNELNQLTRIREGNVSTGPIIEEYIWHPLEERILVKDVFSNGVKNYSVYYVNQNYILIENSSGNYSEKYLYIDNQLVAFVDTDGNKRFVHSDHLGSVSLVTDINGNVVEETFYSPYGEILSGGRTSRFDYVGKEFDSVTRDYDFNFRKCKPEWGCLFLQPDTLVPNRYDPQQLNRYSYAKSNPYKYKDESGHFPVLIAAAALIGGVYNTVQYYATHDNPTLGGAATYFATGAAQGALLTTNIVLLGGVAILGEVAERIADDESLTENKFDYFAEGAFAIAGGKLVKEFLPNPVGAKNINYFSSVFTKKSGQQFITNQLIENIGISAGQNAYYNNPNTLNIADNSNKASLSLGGGGGTYTLGRNSPQQAIKEAGGSTLKTAAQRATSESIAAKIINKQRTAAKKSSSRGR